MYFVLVDKGDTQNAIPREREYLASMVLTLGISVH